VGVAFGLPAEYWYSSSFHFISLVDYIPLFSYYFRFFYHLII